MANVNVSGVGGTGGLTYNWDNGLSSTQSQSLSPIITTIYSVYATDDNSCSSDTIQITVIVKDPLSVQVLQDDTICSGTNVSISSIVSIGIVSSLINVKTKLPSSKWPFIATIK